MNERGFEDIEATASHDESSGCDTGRVGRLPVGTLVRGTYRVEAFLGGGGAGLVYRCSNILQDNKQVALKVLSPKSVGDPNLGSRFEREVKISSRIRHPNVTQTLDYIVHDGFMGYVAEYVPGGNLGSYIEQQGALPIEEVCGILVQVARGLAAIHGAGVVHRDLKPHNILRSNDGSIKISDFGIAKARDSIDLTQQGSLIGSVEYLSPEYIQTGRCEQSNDIYALGVMAFQMLTGRLPHRAATAFDAMRLATEETAPPVKAFRPDCPIVLSDIVALLLERDPKVRLQSATDFIHEILRHKELAETVGCLDQELLGGTALGSKLVVWAHNDPEISAEIRDSILSFSYGPLVEPDPLHAGETPPRVQAYLRLVRRAAVCAVLLIILLTIADLSLPPAPGESSLSPVVGEFRRLIPDLLGVNVP